MDTAEKLQVQLKSQPGSETALERLLKRIRHTDDFPAVSKYLAEINQKASANIECSNASDLANVILKDYSLTNKLLKLVNSAFYGLATNNVTTVTRAVVVLGYESIRMTALSLVLFDKFKNKSNTKVFKEVVVSSFWSGVISREIAKLNDNIDPEEAFVCSLMNRLGELAMIYYLPDVYRKIHNCILEKDCGPTKAAKSVCGVTYEELGLALADQWNFPPQIRDSMKPLTKDDLKDKKNPPSAMLALTSFVHDLSLSIQNNDLSNSNEVFEDLIRRYKRSLKISKRQLKKLIDNSIGLAQKHACAMNIDLDNSFFLKQLSSLTRYPGKTPLRPEDMELENDQPSLGFHLTDDDELKVGMDGQNLQSSEDIILEGIEEISRTLIEGHNVNDIALMSLEILYRSLQFKRALMFIRDVNSRYMNVRFGYGDDVARLIGSVKFKANVDKDLFNFSIQKGKDLIVTDAYDAKISNLIPKWYRTHIDAPAFIFLPVLVKDVCMGAFYADRDKNGPPVSAKEHRHLNMLRNQLILAITYRR
ncbi:MAG: HDOD domain-containing protein [Desulfobacteraceae bacterium]|nr:HDOD domain-containing protein [Desulfobacteraceae bacterium]